MPIKEALVKILAHRPDGEWYKLPVFYTDELVETSVYDLAHSAVQGGFLPYLFVEYFTNGRDFNKWYFSNARRHEEMHEAIVRDLGQEYNYTCGQIWFNPPELRMGKLRFNRLILHSPLPNKEAIELLRKSIRPDLLLADFDVFQART